MNTITSSEFRKTYPKLKEPTIVSVLGYAIGVWMPAPAAAEPQAREAFKAFEPPTAVYPERPTAKAQQANRDAILRKINRGG